MKHCLRLSYVALDHIIFYLITYYHDIPIYHVKLHYAMLSCVALWYVMSYHVAL